VAKKLLPAWDWENPKIVIELKRELSLLLSILVLIGPYLLLFYKKAGLRKRLLFASICEIFILCTLLVIDFWGNGILIEAIFFYNQFVWASIFLNFIVIFLSWGVNKKRINDPKT
jgi:hypothetical protein